MTENPAVQRLCAVPIGTRVVVRHAVSSAAPDGPHFTDALGELIEIGTDSCRIATRRGEVVIQLSDVALAKPVPPAPQRRGLRQPPGARSG